jgi:aspartate aminotransferase-like enzyme
MDRVLIDIDRWGNTSGASVGIALDEAVAAGRLRRGDLVAIFSAGAYGYAMASNYNSFPRPCEVLVSGSDAKVVTARETYEDLLRNERIVSFSLTGESSGETIGGS